MFAPSFEVSGLRSEDATMATMGSRAATMELSRHHRATTNTRRLQEALYTHLDEHERAAFIDVLNNYGARRDIFELVNSLRKILNTPVKRHLFPLVRSVLRTSDVAAFDLLTRGGRAYGTLPRPFLYRPHVADLSVLRKHRAAVAASTSGRLHEAATIGQKRKCQSLASDPSTRDDLPRDKLTVKVVIQGWDEDYDGFGFNIRGGAEYGLDVYVSSVDAGGPADVQGLQVGDQITAVNGISFQRIQHAEAARIIRSTTRLELLVHRVGRVPASQTVHEAYKWVDARGRPVSPPPDLMSAGDLLDDVDIRSRSSLNLLKGDDERKVNIVVSKGHTLGLTVRGGKEFSLGIYISGVDPFSVAESAGLKVGDQILDVNGQTLVGVTHVEAVRILTRSRHMMLTVKDVGRVPYAKSTTDHSRLGGKDGHSTRGDQSYGRYEGRRTVSEPDLTAPAQVGFSRGAGSQLMLSAMTSRPHWEAVEDQARLLLNAKEQATLRYYLSEYGKNSVQVKGLVVALTELLNTGAKMTLISGIRTLVQPRDLDDFDSLLQNHQKQTGVRHTNQTLDFDAVSLMSEDSGDAFLDEMNMRTLFSTTTKPAIKPTMMEPLGTKSSSASSRHEFGGGSGGEHIPYSHKVDVGISASPSPEVRHNGTATRASPLITRPVPFTRGQARRVKGQGRSRSRSPGTHGSSSGGPAPAQPAARVSIVKAEVHPRVKTDDPSDDSGVDVNSHQPQHPPHTFGLDGRPRYNPNRQSKRVTISQDSPVDIETGVAAHLLSDRTGAPGAPGGSVSGEAGKAAGTGTSAGHLSQEEELKHRGREKYGDVPLQVVYIYRCKPTLGVAIEGGANTRQPLPRVISVQPGGSAFESGGLKVGHVILEVNGVALAGKGHTEVAKLIAETFKDKEQGRMELLVTESSDEVMERLLEKLGGLVIAG